MIEPDGIDDGWKLPGLASVTDFTLAVEFVPYGTGNQHLFYLNEDNDAVGFSFMTHRSTGSTSAVSAYVGVTGAFTPVTRITPGVLHRLVLRRDGDQATTWIDGVLVNTANVGTDPVTWANFTIAHYNYTPDGGFCHALYRELGFWKSAWTDGMIEDHAAGDSAYSLGATDLTYHLDFTVNPPEELVSDATVTVVGSPTLAVPSAQVRSATIPPGMGTIVFLIEDTGNNLTKLLSRIDHPTIKINGGSPITLANPLWSTAFAGIIYPLNQQQTIVTVDDGDDDCDLIGAGWTEDVPYEFGALGHYYLGDAYYYTAGPTDTAVITLEGVAVGLNQLQAIIPDGGGFTEGARYVVKEGVNVLATIDYDQSQTTRSFDDVGSQRHWTILGTFTVPPTPGTVTVTVSNQAGANTLGIDGIRAKQVIVPLVTDGDEVTFSAPELWLSAVAGFVGASTDEPVTFATVDEWYPWEDEGPKTLKIGQNLEFPHHYAPVNFYANRKKLSRGWQPVGVGTVLDIDPTTGDLTADTVFGEGGYANITAIKESFVYSWIDTHGIPSFGPGTWRFRYAPSLEGAGPFVVQPYCDDGEWSVTNISAHTLAGDGKYEFTFDVEAPEFQHHYRPALKLKTYGAIKLPDIYDPDTPEGWDKLVHPYVYNAFHGTGQTVLRAMDLLSTNAGNVSRWSDLDSTGWVSFEYGSRFEGAGVLSMGPVDTSISDTDGAVLAFGNLNLRTIIKVTCDAPHGIEDGQLVRFYSMSQVRFGDTRGEGAETQLSDNAITHIAYRLTDTTFMCSAIWDGSTGPPYDHNAHTIPVTLDGEYVVTGFCEVHVSANTIPLPHIVQACNELGVNLWMCVPVCMENMDEVGLLFDYIAVNLNPGRKCYGEYGNEPWNYSFRQWAHLWVRGRQGGFGNSMACMAERASVIHAKAVERFVAAGRPATDVIRVMGVQGDVGGEGSPTDVVVTYCEANDIEFDFLALAHYDNTGPLDDSHWYLGTDNSDAAFDRFNPADLADVAVACIRHGGRGERILSHRDQLDAHGFTGTAIGLYESSYEKICPRGSNTLIKLEKSWGASRHPLWRRVELTRLQVSEDHGVVLDCQFQFQGQNGITDATYWHLAITYNDPPVVGDDSDDLGDNRDNLWDIMNTGSVRYRAHLDWAAFGIDGGGGGGATSYTVTSASTGTVGVPQNVTVTLDAADTVIVTLTSAEGTFSDATVSFTGTAGPITVTFTPTVEGPATITSADNSDLADPAPVVITVAPAPELSTYSQYRIVDFGSSRAGLATVGYTLTGGSRITAGVAEVGTGTGIYGVTLNLADDFAGSILWDTGQGVDTVYAAGAINPPAAGGGGGDPVMIAEDGLDAALDAPGAVGGGSIREALEAVAAVLAGDLVQDTSSDGQTATDTFAAFKDNSTVAISSTSTRTSRNVELPL